MAAILDFWEGMTGTMLPYAFSTPPANGGWLLCDGSVLLSTTPHKALRAKLIADGMKWGSDGSGNPKIPNTCGEFMRGADNGRGVDVGRALGTVQGGSLVAFDAADPGAGVTTATPSSQADLPAYGFDPATNAHWAGKTIAYSNQTGTTLTTPTNPNFVLGFSRPRNIAANYIIKT